MALRHHSVLAVISNCYSEPLGRFPRVTHPCATRPRRISFDLHVLGMPPAFVLSQDQTLKFDVRSDARWNNPAPNRSFLGACLHLGRPSKYTLMGAPENACPKTSTLLTYGYVKDIQTDLALTEYLAPKNRQDPEPPPTCPFI